jgi:hypothetical protein
MIATRDKLQTQIMNRWNAFHKAEENNYTRQYIKGLEDVQAEDQARSTELKTTQSDYTSKRDASTVQADIDEYNFQLFMIQNEIDELKTRIDA